MLKIFLVDDSGLVRRRLSALIGALDSVVIVGESEEADSALGCIRMTRADLVIVDPHLAGGSGMEIVESLARATSPVLTMVLTNHSGPAFRAACQRAGASYFFDKTGEYELARDTIVRLANKHRRERIRCEPA
ncbi:response regulator [Caballeronia sp. dw_19]|uniref:response regulator n=1 Tax=unclassified Caballeronia TaxID=2646786 RepID=UPI001BD4B231|nr:response regulator [Caballeronia sp. dw_19]